MIASFPILCMLLMLFIHSVVGFGPISLRQHRVRYRPLTTRLADTALIMRLAFSVFCMALAGAWDAVFRRSSREGARRISAQEGA